jgi:hypothetical protein
MLLRRIVGVSEKRHSLVSEQLYKQRKRKKPLMTRRETKSAYVETNAIRNTEHGYMQSAPLSQESGYRHLISSKKSRTTLSPIPTHTLQSLSPAPKTESRWCLHHTRDRQLLTNRHRPASRNPPASQPQLHPS